MEGVLPDMTPKGTRLIIISTVRCFRPSSERISKIGEDNCDKKDRLLNDVKGPAEGSKEGVRDCNGELLSTVAPPFNGCGQYKCITVSNIQFENIAS